MKIFYSPEYAIDSDLETVSKSRLIARMLEGGRIPGTEVIPSKPVTRKELLQIHDAPYVDSVLSGSIGRLAAGDWSPELLRSILFSTGGMRDAVHEALRSGCAGCLASGQHHAKRNRGFALCTINGIALAAIEALKHVKSVGILDLDAHFGGGTFAILGSDERIHLSDVSVEDLDRWTPTDVSRHHSVEVQSAAEYLAAVRRALARMDSVDFLIYYAGMDPHENAGGIPGINARILQKRDRMVAAWWAEKKVPVIFAPAGGYAEAMSLEELAALHLDTIRAFAEVR